MSTLNTIVAPFTINPPPSTVGFTNITEYTFTPNFSGDFIDNFHKNISSKTVWWNFGDGSVLSSIDAFSVSHIYKWPGTYTISFYVYDNEGEAYINTLTQSISVKNFVPTRLLAQKTQSDVFFAGVLSEEYNKFTVAVSASWQDYDPQGNTVMFAPSGSKSKKFDTTLKYSHLLPYNDFYIKDSNDNFKRVDDLTLNLKPVYYYLQGTNTPTLTTSTASGARMLGASGSQVLYYFDDLPGPQKINFSLSLPNNKLPYQYIANNDISINRTGLSFLETPTVQVPVTGIRAIPKKVIFTSTGLKDMPVFRQKRVGDKFQVFVSVGDSDNNIFKYYAPFVSAANPTASNQINITFDNTYTSVTSVSTSFLPYNALTKQSEVSSFYYVNITPSTSGVKTLNASITIPLSGGTQYLSTFSDSIDINVLPVSTNQMIYKINEDFDMQETIKSYRFQSFLQKYDKLFDGVIGTIFGTVSSLPTSVGKTLYEGIANFVINNSDVDTCDLKQLYGMSNMLNTQIKTDYLNTPPELKRLLDLFTVKISRLIGSKEKFEESFETCFSSNTALGKNIDFTSPINTLTYIVTAGTKFVAHQKFDNKFLVINPMYLSQRQVIGSGSSTLSTYPLSSWNQYNTWGWSLMNTVTGAQLSAHYDFYPFVNIYNSNRQNNLIDYDNIYTTLNSELTTLTTWTLSSGILQKQFDYQLRNGLDL